MIAQSLSSIGPAIANHLWQSTVFAVTAWLITLLLRRNAARVRYTLWLAASIKFLVPFSLLIGIGNLLPKPHAAIVPSQRTMYSAMDLASQPFTSFDLPTPNTTTHAASATQQLTAFLPNLLASAWLCGAATVLLMWLGRYRQVSAALHRATSADEGREAAILRHIDAHTRVTLRLSPDQMEPGIFGILHPVLVWPQQLSQCLEDEHIEAILTHELMHVQRRDNLTAALHMFVEAAFWFHPLVWWIERRMIEERERACDEAVVQSHGKAEAYAESLLKACRFCLESPLPCVSGITGADLSKRVRSIMTSRLEKVPLVRKMLLAAFGLSAVTVPVIFGVIRMIPLYGQTLESAGPLPSFAVATIKPSKDSGHGFATMAFPNGRYAGRNITVQNLIKIAYGIPISNDDQVSGGPSWAHSAGFDVEAKEDRPLPPDVAKNPDYRLMIRSLLEDRFKLKVHHETREVPVYALTIQKNGPKLTPSNRPPLTPNTSYAFGANLPTPRKDEWSGTRPLGRGEIKAMRETMNMFVGSFLQLQPEMQGHLVVDKTELKGQYEFTLKWKPEDSMSQGESGLPPENSSLPSLVIALEEQLGLKLVSTKAPVDILVIDHVEQPSEN